MEVMMNGKYMIEKMENMEAMKMAMNMSEEMMMKMMGKPGIMEEVMVSGDSCTMQRSDGMCIMCKMGTEFEVPIGDMMVKGVARMEDKMLIMGLKMPDGKMVEWRYRFDDKGMMIDMTCQNVMMRMCCKKM